MAKKPYEYRVEVEHAGDKWFPDRESCVAYAKRLRQSARAAGWSTKIEAFHLRERIDLDAAVTA